MSHLPKKVEQDRLRPVSKLLNQKLPTNGMHPVTGTWRGSRWDFFIVIIFPFLRVSSAFDSLDVFYWLRETASHEWGACSLNHLTFCCRTWQGISYRWQVCESMFVGFCWLIKKFVHASRGIQTWDLTVCLWLNLKHGELDHTATTAGLVF